MKYRLTLIILFFPLIILAQGEKFTTTNARAIRHFDKALNLYGGRYYSMAEDELKEALSEDPKFLEAHMLLAELYSDLGKTEPGIEEYKKTISLRPDTFIKNYFGLAKLEIDASKYEDAKGHLEIFLAKIKPNSSLIPKAKRMVENCDFAIKAIKEPVPFKPMNLGDSINSKHAEYLPTLTADEQTLIFTQRKPKDPNLGRVEEEDFYISHKTDGHWTKAVNLGPPINTSGNEGAQCISPDGKYLYYTACNRPNGLGSCDIYMAERMGNQWSNPVNLGAPVNSAAWESQPSISSDGRTLYFLSSRKGGFGKTDIWKTTKQENGNWSMPENLGDKINTTENEASPFIHPDNNTLYFASDGLVGMGGADIFYTRRAENGSWQTPKNLGYPINTSADETSLIVSAKGAMAYFASDRPEGKGLQDLYEFELYQQARPQTVSYVKGKVMDSGTKKGIEATFELIDLKSAKPVVESVSDKLTGEFLVCLPTGGEYALNVSKEGYLFYSENFSLKDAGSADKATKMDVMLHPIKVGESVILKNIFFETNDFSLKNESKAELEKLKKFLLNYKDIKIEVSGHTDNSGDKKYNQGLSEKRAKAVYDYLINAGIEAARLTFKGYGDTKPIAPNDNAEGKAKNRRTEFTIISKG